MRTFIAVILLLLAMPAFSDDLAPIKVGWIGAMTGPLAKYGAFQSAQLAQDDVNKSGGINGRRLELIFEDGKGDGKNGANAAQKLISIDKVNYILGGHCSPESLAIAPLAERNKVIMLASITSNPKLTEAGDYIFRLTAVSTRHSELIAPYTMNKKGLKLFAIIHEETDYAQPPAERLAELVKGNGGQVVEFQSYHPGETDFRSIITRIKSKNPEALYLGVQSPDAAILFLRQLKEQGVEVTLLGNEITGNAVPPDPNEALLFEGMIFAEPAFDQDRPITKEFINRFKSGFSVKSLPYGFWTAEAYDAVQLLASVIARCGDTVEDVKKCLYEVKDYQGVSAPVSIDSNGDGVRDYVLKVINNGRVTNL